MGKNPIESEFFTTEDVGNLTAALVRESVQNSLDARDDKTKPVQIRFCFSGKDSSLRNPSVSKYFKNLKKHLLADKNGLRKTELPDFENELQYLLVEDANTCGLEGDYTQSDDPEKDKKNDFYWFWRNIGRSNKSDQDRGRWGLGKSVFPSSSRINTYFGYSVRKSDNVSSFMGLSILKIHKLENESSKISPYGYFGEFEEDDDEYFSTPIINEKNLEDISKDFKLIRENHSGLSIIITFPCEEITCESILREVIRQYYYAIIANDLVVDIEDKTQKTFFHVNRNKIFDIIKEVEYEENEKETKYKMSALFDLCKSIREVDKSNFINLKTPPSVFNVPVWRNDWYVDTEIQKEIDKAKGKFELGEVVYFNIPVKVHPIDSSAEFSNFNVALQYDPQLEESDCHFIRDGIEISGIKPFNKKGLRAIVIIDDNKLSQLLGDSENPAHTEWQRNSKNFKGEYVDGDKVISFVTSSIQKLYAFLHTPAEGIEKNLLDEFFWVDITEEKDTDDGRGDEDGGTKTPDPDLDLDRKKKKISITNSKNGVVISNADGPINSQVKLRFAYKGARGNSFKRYSIYDFELDKAPIKTEFDNVNVKGLGGNILTFIPTETDFKVKVEGFDINRDLIVDVKYI